MENHKRHGCLTAWLWLLLVSNLLSGLLIMEGVWLDFTYRQGAKHFALTTGLLSAFVLYFLVNMVSIVSLLRWKRRGFYGLVAANIIPLTCDLITRRGILDVLLIPLYLGATYGLLRIGGQNCGWSKLN